MRSILKRAIGSEIIKGNISVATYVAILAGLFAPMDFYYTNKKSFFFSGGDVLPFSLLFAVVILCGCTFVLILTSIVSRKLAVVVEGGLLGIFVPLYIIGNFFVVDYGNMDGNEVQWGDFKAEGIIQVTLFCTLLLAFVGMGIFLEMSIANKAFTVISVCISLVMIFTLSISTITVGLKNDSERIATNQGQFELSNNQNLIVLILDSFDSKVFTEMIEMDDRYSEVMQDFTYYPDNTSQYAFTDLSVPNIVTGSKYYNDMTYGDFLSKAYKESDLINKAVEENYALGIYTNCRMPQDANIYCGDNVKNVERTVSSHVKLAKYMYKFVGFRYLPQPLKKYCWFYPEEMKNDIETTVDKDIEIFSSNNYVFYDEINNISATDSEGTVKIYHLDGTHTPFTISADFSQSDTETSIEEEGRGVWVLVEEFLNELKSKDLYDNCAIVILADHGYFDVRGNALLLAKGVGEKHDFVISPKRLSYDCLQDAFVKLLEGRDAEAAFVREGDEERLFMSYSLNGDFEDDSYAESIYEYLVNGEASDKNSYELINTYLPE